MAYPAILLSVLSLGLTVGADSLLLGGPRPWHPLPAEAIAGRPPDVAALDVRHVKR